MSFLTGLITGFLNEDVRLRENQREYEAKLAEKKELARQEIAKENRAWAREELKQNINNNFTLFFISTHTINFFNKFWVTSLGG